MRLQAIVFDLDGTLLDTLADIALAVNEALASENLPTYPIEYYRSRVGWGLPNLMRASVPTHVQQDAVRLERLTHALLVAYARQPVVHTAPYPGILSLLAALRRVGVPLAVLSNKSDELVQDIVTQLFPAETFAAVMGARADRPHKPDPATTLELLRIIGVEAGEAALVGDSDVDMRTARNAGVVPIGVSWGFRDAQTVADAGAAYLCHSVHELAACLRTLGVAIEESKYEEGR